MNGKDLLMAMGALEDCYVQEAEEKYPKGMARMNRRRWGAAAACLAALLCAVPLLLLQRQPQGTIPPSEPLGEPVTDAAQPEETEQSGETGQPEDTEHPDDSFVSAEIQVDMTAVYLNEISGIMDACRKIYDPSLYNTVAWGPEEIAAYYGKDMTPAYLPEGLKAASGNGYAFAVLAKDGEMVEDVLYYNFYHDYFEDGSPRLTENVTAPKGFTLTASKIGILKESFYMMQEDDIKISDICGYSVTIGYLPMSYGPYDPRTNEPSGYYELYTADFEADGIEYEFVSHQLPLEEVVKVIASVLSGREEISIKN